MVTEFVSRGSLFEILHQRRQHLDDYRILAIAKQIAMALLYLHSRKILHCDLKSQNVLLAEDWAVKLCDFGLARYKERFVRENHGKIGTPHWMAPEILRGEPYMEASDVYSFGVVLWEMLTGEIPFVGRSIAQITGLVGYHQEKLEVPRD
jgi:serine/threonine protein kinase